MSCRQLYTSDLLATGGFDGVLDLGDNQYNAGALSAYRTYYDPTWGGVKGITHPVPGNHEYESANASGYYGYFGDAAGDPSKGYYSYDLGKWHIIALNSNCGGVGGCGTGSPEERWLRSDLAAHASSTCTLAYWHHPRFGSGLEHGSNPTYTAFWQALYDYGADVVLAGHEHNYERFAPQEPDGTADAANGIREFVVGTGGAEPLPVRDAHREQPGSQQHDVRHPEAPFTRRATNGSLCPSWVARSRTPAAPPVIEQSVAQATLTLGLREFCLLRPGARYAQHSPRCLPEGEALDRLIDGAPW